MLEQARRRSPDSIEFRRMSATELDYPAGTFAFACAVTVVQHLPYRDQLRAIAELVRVVRRGGHVLTVDRTGARSAFSAVYGTYPRSRGEWQVAWEAAAESWSALGRRSFRGRSFPCGASPSGARRAAMRCPAVVAVAGAGRH